MVGRELVNELPKPFDTVDRQRGRLEIEVVTPVPPQLAGVDFERAAAQKTTAVWRS